MPSSKPLVALRLPVDMHARLLELAAAEDRSPSNFIEHTLRRLLGPQLEPAFTAAELMPPRKKRRSPRPPKHK